MGNIVSDMLGDGSNSSSDAANAASAAQSAIAQAQWKNYLNTYQPVATGIASMFGVTPSTAADAAAAAKVQAAAQQNIAYQEGLVGADAARQGAAAIAANNRQMMSYGINPEDARFAGANRQATMGAAENTIDAENMIPGEERQQEMNFVNMGSSIPAQVSNMYGQAASSALGAGSLMNQTFNSQMKALPTLASAGSALISALATTAAAAADGGEIHAPPGPPNRDTGIITIRDGEYVLPPNTVRAIGGVRALDDLVERTNGRRPLPKYAIPAPRWLLEHVPGHADDGGLIDTSDDAGGGFDLSSQDDTGDTGFMEPSDNPMGFYGATGDNSGYSGGLNYLNESDTPNITDDYPATDQSENGDAESDSQSATDGYANLSQATGCTGQQTNDGNGKIKNPVVRAVKSVLDAIANAKQEAGSLSSVVSPSMASVASAHTQPLTAMPQEGGSSVNRAYDNIQFPPPIPDARWNVRHSAWAAPTASWNTIANASS